MKIPKREREVREAVREISRKYDTIITNEDVELYLVGLASRILDYAKTRLPGIFIDNLPSQELVNRGLEMDNLTLGETIETVVNILKRPDIFARDSVEYIRYFFVTHNDK